VNQQRLHDLLQQAYSTGYRTAQTSHDLAPAIATEIASFRSKVESMPSLALAVAMAKYHFSWYRDGTSEMDTENVEDAANLMYLSIQFSGCDRHDLTPDDFYQRMCSARWPYTVLMYSELGREFAGRYLTDQAANILEKAVAAFDAMKRLPYYSPLAHWQGPYDINFNEEWFPGVQPSGPIWDKALVPLAQVLEANLETIASELSSSIIDRGLVDQLHFGGVRGEGQDHAPLGGWRAVEFAALDPQATNRWGTEACALAPRTCALLAARPELQGCRHSSASLVRLHAGGKLKPQYGAAPQLQCHVVVKADPGARMSVGNETIAWAAGGVYVFDSSYIRQEWHAGVRGDRYVLQVGLCHPCEDSQRALYDVSRVRCPVQATAAASRAPSQVVSATTNGAAVLPVPFAAAALWAVRQPDLALCNSGINERCPPDSQHGGPNPLSALNTWNYALNNLRAALRHAGEAVDPSLVNAINQVQSAIHAFFKHPALEQFGAIVSMAVQIFDAVSPWLQNQPPAQVRFESIPQAAPPHLPPVSSFTGAADLGRVSIGLPGMGGAQVKMPVVGFGTFKLEGPACYESVRWALQAGVRHIDTGEAYHNEAEVGRALRDSGVPRSDVFLAVKATSVSLGMADASYLESIFAGQLQALQTNYVDVYLLHAAGVKGEQLRAVWQGMERLYDMGRAKALGVSNFGVAELEELWAMARVKPAYLQNIFKVYKPGEQILSEKSPDGAVLWAQRHGVAVVGYSVINSWPHMMNPLEDPHVLSVARTHGKTSSQVLHRWALQHGVAVIPKASSEARVRENTLVLDFELTPAEMALLDGLATLSESTEAELRPGWSTDVFGLHGVPSSQLAAPAQAVALPAAVTADQGATPPVAASSTSARHDFQEVGRDLQCNRDLPDVKAEPFTLGGGGHSLAQCQSACAAQALCRFVVYYHGTGFCHMYRNCLSPLAAGDGAVVYART
jgi:diketogulonate reductase-like aldo/keto reductase